jgi:xanthine dehydrogenase large subunit
LWREPNREDKVFDSKAASELPFMLAISVLKALKEAVAAARPGVVRLQAPATAEHGLAALPPPTRS